MSNSQDNSETLIRRERPPLFERLKNGLEEGIAWARGEIDLKITTITIPDPPPAYDASKVREVRQRLGVGQYHFSRMLNVSLKTVQRWETGKSLPSHATSRLLQIIDEPQLLSGIRGEEIQDAATA